ncbi:hypothetical protein GYMLUDRAFT_94490 [Collybiopsis luxurians FD-317 M1]|nr:hypothetical protein GYMLUDRAFT_94490 [Collybiopsis luxurians FD-317 M1]
MANWEQKQNQKVIRFTIKLPGTWPKAPSGLKDKMKKSVTYVGTVMVRNDLQEMKVDDWNRFSGYMTDEEGKKLIFEVKYGEVVGETNVPFDPKKKYGEVEGVQNQVPIPGIVVSQH